MQNKSFNFVVNFIYFFKQNDAKKIAVNKENIQNGYEITNDNEKYLKPIKANFMKTK